MRSPLDGFTQFRDNWGGAGAPYVPLIPLISNSSLVPLSDTSLELEFDIDILAGTIHYIAKTNSTPPDYTEIDGSGLTQAVDSLNELVSLTSLTPKTHYWVSFYVDLGSPDGRSSIVTLDAYTDLAFSAAVARLSASLTGQNFTSVTVLDWDGADIIDTDNYHETVTNDSRISAPVDGWYVFQAQISMQNGTAQETLEVVIRKDGSGAALTDAQVTSLLSSTGTSPPYTQVMSYPIYCLAGEYVQVTIQVQADTSADVFGSLSSFSALRVG